MHTSLIHFFSSDSVLSYCKVKCLIASPSVEFVVRCFIVCFLVRGEKQLLENEQLVNGIWVHCRVNVSVGCFGSVNIDSASINVGVSCKLSCKPASVS